MNPTNIIGISFVNIASSRMANLQSTMDAVLAAENGVLYPILKALFLIFIGRQFLLTMAGHLSMERFFATIIRSGVIIMLVTHSGAFVQWVRDPVFNKIPQAMSAMVAGNYAATTAGQPMAAQFDGISSKSNAISAEIDTVSTSIFSLTDLTNSMSGRLANLMLQIVLAIVVGIWLLGQTLLGIVLSMGPPLLCFEIFDRTRGFVDQWIGKLVGMTAFGLNGMKTMLDAVKAQATANATIAVAAFFQVLGNAVLDLLTMAVLPVAVGFGSGAVAALAAPSAMLVMRSLSMAGGAGAVAARTAKALSMAPRAGNAIRGG
jgi:hypothetical protein